MPEDEQYHAENDMQHSFPVDMLDDPPFARVMTDAFTPLLKKYNIKKLGVKTTLALMLHSYAYQAILTLYIVLWVERTTY